MTISTADPIIIGAVVTVIGTLSGLLRTWLGQRAQARHDAEVTRRLDLLTARTSPGQRVSVIRAWTELEGTCHLHDLGRGREDLTPAAPRPR